ncbi:MAG TPA: glucoamylase family protein [Silvibacterium sp.]|nr:glucoamylase family protein [Silvibacterium sp.]
MTFQVPEIDQPILDAASIRVDELRAHARTASAEWNIVSRPHGALPFLHAIDRARTKLDALNEHLKQLAPDSPRPLLEIRENPRLLRSAISEISTMRRKISNLPRLGDEPRDASLARAYFDAAHSVWNGSALRIYVETAQRSDALELKELWALPSFLKFELLELILTQADAMLHAPGSAKASPPELLSVRLKSLRELGHADWLSLMEPLVVFDDLLQQDPARAYPRMDFDSREHYRKRIAEIACHSDCSETQVASVALELAKEAQHKTIDDPRLYLRRAHVGYYLIDDGFSSLAARIGYRPRFIDRMRAFVRRNADDFYIAGSEILSVLLIAAILVPLIPNYSIFGGLTFAFILLLLPATQAAVDFVNNTVTALFKAHPLPKLDFSKSIPADYTTLVAVPTLLMNEMQVRELVAELEVRFLANPDPNLHFALLTDLPDSVSRPRENDTDPLVDLAVQLITDLNIRYPPSTKHGSFFLLHRHRVFNARQGVWMGWERKRGKLLDLNKYLRGEFDAFPVKTGNLTTLSHVQYIITLDSDTQLPRGTAAAMVGAIAHPLNRAIIDPERRIVTAGYGILQPRIGVSVQSASLSRLAALYSGDTGFDIYTRAVSDVYQDLYGEGSFTGKGIYEVHALHSVLDRRFPRNALLSHDLIEGAYARAGLVTDVELIDDYPSHYSAYTRRQHRWVRGDWQIAQWLFAKVPDESGRFVRNPISTISRWKIFDNLRRSLVDPFTLILLVAGWLGLPGGALYWTAVTLLLLLAPTFVQLVFGLGRAIFSEQQGGISEAINGFRQAIFLTVLKLAFLPHQTMFSFDAIVRSLVRRFVTGQRLLEWETAAEAESSRAKTTPVDRYLAATSAFALAIAFAIAATHPRALFVAAPILILWGFTNGIILWLNRPPREEKQRLDAREEIFLRHHALRIWRFFHEFGGARHNFLIPDNVEERDLFEAARVSPTNFGLLLNSRQAAVKFGFLTVPEFCDLTRQSFATMDRLPKFRGHLFNWYDTHTLQPLLPATVSSVDSGNLSASLYTLHTGAGSLLSEPLLSAALFRGLETHWQLLASQSDVSPKIKTRPMPSPSASLHDWCSWVFAVAELEAFTGTPDYTNPSHDETAWWLHETKTRLRAITSLIEDYLPWLSSEFEPLLGIQPLGLRSDHLPPLSDCPALVGQLQERLSHAASSDSGSQRALIEKLRTALAAAHDRLRALVMDVRAVSLEAVLNAEAMEFGFLVQKGRQLLSIGFEVASGKLHDASYDMLASEARIATFIAVSRGELSQQGWFKMARTHTSAFGCYILLSWTGTMFEYLMPSLWMRSYPDTLIARSISSAVEIQRRFAKSLGIPWGISESGYGKIDDAGHYSYQAFGIPQIAVKWDAVAGPVISPYSTFLALGADPDNALHNLHRMDNAGWCGAYGMYEAADYSESAKNPALVREWMAHHQGMAILAILNLIEKNIVQEWFHGNRIFQANELLLHEKPIRVAALKAEQKQSAA